MKKLIPVLSLMILVWGCAKKITPADSGSTGSGMPAGNAPGKLPDAAGSTAAATGTADNTGTFGTKVEPKEKTAELSAAIAGQTTYNAKCGSCHGLKVTTDFTAERWASIMAVMAPRAKLSDVEKENVYAYVKANAKK
jgi:mono/diheme cytochrome c family protein